MAKSDDAVAIEELSKRYSGAQILALNRLSLAVQPGEVYGFLGPNGAGKSTTIRMLLNFIQPTGGTARIFGKDIVKDSVEIRRSIGYLAGDFAAYLKMTSRQFLEYMSELQPPKHRSRGAELADIFKLDLGKQIGALSKGNRQKLGVVQAFMHEPELLILDEPTSGLDPLMQEEFYKLVRASKARGATLFISSHNLSEVQKMCDRVAIIKDGKLVNESAIADLELEAAQTFEIFFAGKPPLAELKRLVGVKVVEHPDNIVKLHVHGDLSPLFALLAKNKVQKVVTGELNLEEEFMRFYETESKR